MEPPMSNGSMQHQNLALDFDDTRKILQGASCTIAARARARAEGNADHRSASCARVARSQLLRVVQGGRVVCRYVGVLVPQCSHIDGLAHWGGGPARGAAAGVGGNGDGYQRSPPREDRRQPLSMATEGEAAT